MRSAAALKEALEKEYRWYGTCIGERKEVSSEPFSFRIRWYRCSMSQRELGTSIWIIPFGLHHSRAEDRALAGWYRCSNTAPNVIKSNLDWGRLVFSMDECWILSAANPVNLIALSLKGADGSIPYAMNPSASRLFSAFPTPQPISRARGGDFESTTNLFWCETLLPLFAPENIKCAFFLTNFVFV